MHFISFYVTLYVQAKLRFAGEGANAPPPRYFFCRNFFFCYWVEEGKIAKQNYFLSYYLGGVKKKHSRFGTPNRDMVDFALPVLLAKLRLWLHVSASYSKQSSGSTRYSNEKKKLTIRGGSLNFTRKCINKVGAEIGKEYKWSYINTCHVLHRSYK